MKLKLAYNKNNKPILYEFASVGVIDSISANNILCAFIANKIFPIKFHARQRVRNEIKKNQKKI